MWERWGMASIIFWEARNDWRTVNVDICSCGIMEIELPVTVSRLNFDWFLKSGNASNPEKSSLQRAMLDGRMLTLKGSKFLPAPISRFRKEANYGCLNIEFDLYPLNSWKYFRLAVDGPNDRGNYIILHRARFRVTSLCWLSNVPSSIYVVWQDLRLISVSWKQISKEVEFNVSSIFSASINIETLMSKFLGTTSRPSLVRSIFELCE